MKKKFVSIKNFADLSAIRRQINNAFSEKSAEVAKTLNHLLTEPDDSDVEVNEEELKAKVEEIFKKDGSFDYMQINKMDIVGVSLVACPANGETLERAEEIKNATRFKKLENKNNTNIDEMFV